MKLVSLLGIGLIAALSVPAAGVTFFSIGGAPDPGLAPYETSVINFDSAVHAGIIASQSGAVGLYTGSSSSAAAPAGDITRYQAIGTGGSATYDFRGYIAASVRPVRSVSVYVGSVDRYNYIDVLDSNLNVITTIGGVDLPGNNGDQGAAITNRRLYINFDPSDSFGGLTFRSTGVAFEYDTISVSSARYRVTPGDTTPGALPPLDGVPEPEVWAMMLIGFGLVGMAARRRSRPVSA